MQKASADFAQAELNRPLKRLLPFSPRIEISTRSSRFAEFCRSSNQPIVPGLQLRQPQQCGLIERGAITLYGPSLRASLQRTTVFTACVKSGGRCGVKTMILPAVLSAGESAAQPTQTLYWMRLSRLCISADRRAAEVSFITATVATNMSR